MYGNVIVISDESLKKDGKEARKCRCENCKEEFIRQVRHLNKKHVCSSFIEKDGQKLKWCFKCKSFLPLIDFQKAKHVYGGYCKNCRKCRAIYMESAENRRRTKNSEYAEKQIFNKRYFAARLKGYSNRAKARNINFDLDVEYIMSLWKSQNGICLFTGFNMKRKNNSSGFFSPSLDRLDPQKGYVKGNVVWCIFAINSFKQELNLEEFINIVKNLKPLNKQEILEIANSLV